jgi:hypothetical protein
MLPPLVYNPGQNFHLLVLTPRVERCRWAKRLAISNVSFRITPRSRANWTLAETSLRSASNVRVADNLDSGRIQSVAVPMEEWPTIRPEFGDGFFRMGVSDLRVVGALRDKAMIRNGATAVRERAFI